MEIPIQSLRILLSFFLPAFILFRLLSTRKSTRHNLPPGPWKLPLIGNIHNLLGAVPHRALHQLALKHGPLMHMQLGEVSAVIISSADTAKEVMKTHDTNFASRPPILAAEIMSYGCTSITFGPYGDYWRQLRKICTLELLSTKRVQSFRSLREQVFSDFTKWIASMEGLPLNLTEKLYSSTYSFVATAAVGKISEEQEGLVPVIKEGIGLAAGFDIAEIYPSVKVFRKMSRLSRRLSELHKKADAILEGIIEQHREREAIAAENESKEEDLVDVLLKFQSHDLQIPLTTDNIKSVILDMLTAGSETSATTMDWAMAEMMKNPRVLEKAQEEVRQIFDEEGYVDESRIPQLKYLKAIVKETLRMHPPLPLLLPRKCGETCEINGYEITAEAKIIVNAWAVNRDPNYWENAECFQPERFLDSLVDYKGSNFEFIPFGAGRRMCPGMTFGLANVELPLAMFLYHFDWELGDGIRCGEMDMTEGFGLTARRVKDLCLIPLIKRPLSHI